jgi:uncharacterized protein
MARMSKTFKVQYFGSEGRENLPSVIRAIKLFLSSTLSQGFDVPRKIVFLTREGEGPMLAHNHLQSSGIKIIAVTFPRHYGARRPDNSFFRPEIPDSIQRFFNAFEIPIITNRLPFDSIEGVDSHNSDMDLIKNVLGLFGSSIPLAVQAVLQATDAGYVDIGEQVIAATGDAAILVTASTTRQFLRKDHFGFAVNEIICKPRELTMRRKEVASQLASPDRPISQIEGKASGETEDDSEE